MLRTDRGPRRYSVRTGAGSPSSCCSRHEHKPARHVMILDEINRANLALRVSVNFSICLSIGIVQSICGPRRVFSCQRAYSSSAR